jgi:membrane protein
MIGTESAKTETKKRNRRLWRILVRPFWRAVLRFLDHEGLELAGYIAFSVLLALFPFILFLVALSGFVGQSAAVQEFMEFAFDYLPTEVGRALYPVVSSIVLNPPASGILTFSMLGTLWVASSGVEALRTALDRAYGVTEPRAFWLRRLQGLGFVFGGAGGVFVVVLLIVVGPLAWEAAMAIAPFLFELQGIFNIVRYVVGSLALLLVIWCLYRLLPNVKQRWINALPGAIFATASWLFVATVYSMYLTNVTNYSVTYGSLGGIIGALMFFFFTAIIFIYGAELNFVLMEMSEDSEKPTEAVTA